MNIGKASLFIAGLVAVVFVLWEFVLVPLSKPAPKAGHGTLTREIK